MRWIHTTGKDIAVQNGKAMRLYITGWTQRQPRGTLTVWVPKGDPKLQHRGDGVGSFRIWDMSVGKGLY